MNIKCQCGGVIKWLKKYDKKCPNLYCSKCGRLLVKGE